MQLKILSTNSLLKSIAFLINYALNNIYNIENMLKVIFDVLKIQEGSFYILT